MRLLTVFLFLILSNSSFAWDCAGMYKTVEKFCKSTQNQCIGLAGCIERRTKCNYNHKASSNCEQINTCMEAYETEIDELVGRNRNAFHTFCNYNWSEQHEQCENQNETYDMVTMFCPGRMRLVSDRDKEFNCEGPKKTLRRYISKCNEVLNDYKNKCGFHSQETPQHFGKCKELDMIVPNPDAGHGVHAEVNDSDRGEIKPVIANSESDSNVVSADEK